MKDIFSLKIKKNKVVETIKAAGWFGIFIAAFTPIAFIILNDVNSISTLDLIILGSWSLLYLVLGIGTLLKSRFSAISLLILYIIDTIYLFIIIAIGGMSNIGGIIVRIFLSMIFVRGAKATIIYHKHLKKK